MNTSFSRYCVTCDLQGLILLRKFLCIEYTELKWADTSKNFLFQRNKNQYIIDVRVLLNFWSVNFIPSTLTHLHTHTFLSYSALIVLLAYLNFHAWFFWNLGVFFLVKVSESLLIKADFVGVLNWNRENHNTNLMF